MKTVVYINNDMIQIIQAQYDGSFDIKTQCAIELEAGSVINGVILNREELINKLRELKDRLKKAILIIDSSSIIVKNIEIPKMNKLQAKELLNYELGIQDVQEEYIYDVNLFQEKNKHIIMGSAVTKQLIESYIEVFKEVGIKLAKIDILANSVSKFIKFQKSLENETLLLNVISGENMLSFLFEDGKYKLVNRNKLLFDSDSNEYIEELFSKLSSMIQFQKSQKTEFNISMSYYVGLGKENTKKLDDYVALYEPEVSIREMVLPSNKLSGTDGSLFYALTGIFENKKDINFILAYKESLSNSKFSKATFLKASIPALLCAAIFASYSFMIIDQKKLETEILNLNNYISNENNISKLAEYDEYTNLRQKFKDILSEITESREGIDSSKIIDKKSIGKIFEKAGNDILIDGLTYDSSKKIISISGSSKNVLECSEFVANLYDTKLFEEVSYKGYAHDEIEASGASLFEGDDMQGALTSLERYRFTAKAVLKVGDIVE